MPVATTPQPCRVRRNLFAFVTNVTCFWSAVTRVHANSNIVWLVVHRSGNTNRSFKVASRATKARTRRMEEKDLSRTYTRIIHVHDASKAASFGIEPYSKLLEFSIRPTRLSEKVADATLPCLASNSFHPNIIQATFCKRFAWRAVQSTVDILLPNEKHNFMEWSLVIVFKSY